ncbi:hypothetical protein [Novosphingobium mangrovi (ex Huang et al. 2023)]|uniref:SnoaL-like domain-containing protein n=1 Tax=Novosphingobium mangrovi (ex Huang et al. 2023) TaxID=2976432 RepID=A0ABT2I9R2_9SPHN|nr:hypothetical protein [Novosphingobium mangrovi (ex Huang et al. 2023)]MCT2401560.1 hypothetical protein [Novosphingobium mangrovi (ex Huang et al. 2023)]
MQMYEMEDVIGDYTGLSRKAMEYGQTTKALVDAAKQPGFDSARWNEIGAFLDTNAFERVGNFKEVMDWPTYRDFLTGWAPTADWECSFKRVTEKGNLVLLELEERTTMGGMQNAVNSLSVYEFDDAGKIRHLDIYLQMPLPDPAMLAGYADVDIAG